jgi:hypothetical protein
MTSPLPEPLLFTREEVAQLLKISTKYIQEHPERFEICRFGRSVRYTAESVYALARPKHRTLSEIIRDAK